MEYSSSQTQFSDRASFYILLFRCVGDKSTKQGAGLALSFLGPGLFTILWARFAIRFAPLADVLLYSSDYFILYVDACRRYATQYTDGDALLVATPGK